MMGGGRLVSRVDPAGGEISYSYDDAGRLVRVADSAGAHLEYTYDAASRVVSAGTEDLVSSWIYGDGAVTGHRLEDADGSVLARTEVSRDEFSRVISLETRDAQGQRSSLTYGYDDASQLVATLGSAVGQKPGRYEYDTAGRLVRTVSADGRSRVFTYDAASQLSSVDEAGGPRFEFVYDGLGRRVRQVGSDGSVREFSYGATGFLSRIRLADGAGEVTDHSIVTDALGEVAQVDGVDLFWDSAALVPSLVAVGEHSLGLAPATKWRVARSADDADPFGVPGVGSAGGQVAGALAGFALSADGVPVVAGVELMGARGYDPGTGSFLSVDPLAPVVGAAWGSNPYSYAGNNPVNQSDPWGLRPATDADLAAYKEANQGLLADAGDFLAENWEYIAGAAMVVVGGLLMFTGVGGFLGASLMSGGASLMSGGASMIMQKASTGSVDPVQLVLDMLPGGPVVQSVVGVGSAVYSYSQQPGPHNVAALVGDAAVAGLSAALPGPSSSSRAVVGGVGSEVVETGATKAARSVVPEPHLSTTRLDYAGGAGTTTGMGKLEDISPAPRTEGDIAIEQKLGAPRLKPFKNRTVGRTPSQNADVQLRAQEAYDMEALDIRIDQQQVNAQRQRVGINRPDLQYTFDGKRYYLEYDRTSSTRGTEHAERIKANDPDFGGIELITMD